MAAGKDSQALRRKKWFLYVKPPPCADPEAVLAYLARYTHRVAISNSRLLGLDERGVTFRYKDYRRDGRARLRTIRGEMAARPHRTRDDPSLLHLAGQPNARKSVLGRIVSIGLNRFAGG